MIYGFSVTYFLIGCLAIACARVARPDRNYWPMLRVILNTIGFVYGGSSVSTALRAGPSSPLLRGIFALAMFGALSYGVWFVYRRNHTARIIRLGMTGEPHIIPVEELSYATELTIGQLRHGVMKADEVQNLETALTRWHELENWKAPLRDDPRTRKETEY